MTQLHFNQFDGFFKPPAYAAGARRWWRRVCTHGRYLRPPAKSRQFAFSLLDTYRQVNAPAARGAACVTRLYRHIRACVVADGNQTLQRCVCDFGMGRAFGFHLGPYVSACNPSGRGRFFRFRRRSSLGDTRYPSLVAPRTRENRLPATHTPICRYNLGDKTWREG
jgi:hypothetical protein